MRRSRKISCNCGHILFIYCKRQSQNIDTVTCFIDCIITYFSDRIFFVIYSGSVRSRHHVQNLPADSQVTSRVCRMCGFTTGSTWLPGHQRSWRSGQSPWQRSSFYCCHGYQWTRCQNTETTGDHAYICLYHTLVTQIMNWSRSGDWCRLNQIQIYWNRKYCRWIFLLKLDLPLMRMWYENGQSSSKVWDERTLDVGLILLILAKMKHSFPMRVLVLMVCVIQTGDRILSINDQSTEGMTHDHAGALLESTRGDVSLEVESQWDTGQSMRGDCRFLRNNANGRPAPHQPAGEKNAERKRGPVSFIRAFESHCDLDDWESTQATSFPSVC